jgi:hypothetical protein
VTEFGIITDVKLEQPVKALSPIEVTESPIIKVESLFLGENVMGTFARQL